MSVEILIALADEALAEKYTRYFRNCGFQVAQAWSGLDCWESLRRLQPAALILDAPLLWGGSDGVLARLREEFTETPIPVVLLEAGLDEPEIPSTRLEVEEAFPVVARFPSTYRMSAGLNALVAGLRDFRSESAEHPSEQLALV